MEELKQLKEKALACQECEIRAGCKQVVFGEGNHEADLMLVGEGPGFVEDCTGIPLAGLPELLRSECGMCALAEECFAWFLTGKRVRKHTKCVGYIEGKPLNPKVDKIHTAGQVLDDLLAKAGILRENIWITNVIRCRPPENRTPNDEETKNCGEYLQKQIELIKPKTIIAMGKVALSYFKPENDGIGKERGKVIDYSGINVIPTWHPAYILRREGKDLVKAKWEIWNDFNKLKA